jgi:hypothetical protein
MKSLEESVLIVQQIIDAIERATGNENLKASLVYTLWLS